VKIRARGFPDEVQFRRAGALLIAKKYREAESSYAAMRTRERLGVLRARALQAGWTLYKQQLYQEALPPVLRTPRLQVKAA